MAIKAGSKLILRLPCCGAKVTETLYGNMYPVMTGVTTACPRCETIYTLTAMVHVVIDVSGEEIKLRRQKLLDKNGR